MYIKYLGISIRMGKSIMGIPWWVILLVVVVVVVAFMLPEKVVLLTVQRVDALV
jgi:hypothetical protein